VAEKVRNQFNIFKDVGQTITAVMAQLQGLDAAAKV
jgi:hypothetical protein